MLGPGWLRGPGASRACALLTRDRLRPQLQPYTAADGYQCTALNDHEINKVTKSLIQSAVTECPGNACLKGLKTDQNQRLISGYGGYVRRKLQVDDVTQLRSQGGGLLVAALACHLLRNTGIAVATPGLERVSGAGAQGGGYSECAPVASSTPRRSNDKRARSHRGRRCLHASARGRQCVGGGVGQLPGLGILTADNVNPRLLRIQYAVRGAVLARAEQIEADIAKGKKYPFQRVIRAGVGDSQALGYKATTFLRQVMSLSIYPAAMRCLDVPEDVEARVRLILDTCLGKSLGAISPSLGLRVVREHARSFLMRRDGLPVQLDDVFLANGASDVARTVLQLFVNHVDGMPTGVMIPSPQYPIFSGFLSELGLVRVDFHLAEDRGWSCDLEEMERAWCEGSQFCRPRCIVFINPGNPTGHVMSEQNMREVIRFAFEKRLFILADEVYQQNVLHKPFHSFKKVCYSMGEPYSLMPQASIMSLSKGWAGEVGFRSALCELVNVPAEVRAAAYASRALLQCASVPGQVAMDCVFAPPQEGDPSFAQFAEQCAHKKELMTRRAATAQRVLNSIPGYFCNEIDGAMFAYPRFELPAAAQARAREQGLEPDEFYCLRLLEETGIVVVPGSRFGQRPGTFHFRVTVINPKEDFKYMMKAIKLFHQKFLTEYEKKS